MEAGEEATDAVQHHFAQLLHQSEVNWEPPKKRHCTTQELLLKLLLQLHAAHWLQQSQNLNQ
jgi:hypothetical protein